MKDPDFDIAFSIGRFHIYWYAILLAAGIAAAMMITDRRAKRRDVPKDISLDLCILGVPFGIVGARLFACLAGQVAWVDFLDLTRSGLSFFGGVIFSALAILVYLKLRKVDGIGIAVWGDFFNRVHYGPLVEKASHKWFPLATFGDDLKIHYAAFFYEFLLCVLLIVVYYVLMRKMIQRKGDRFLLMSLVYCLGRFGIDSIRQDLVMVGPLAFDQLCELVLAVICLALLLLKRQPRKAEEGKEKQPTTAEAAKPIEEDDPSNDSIPRVEPEKEEDFTGLQ